MKHCEPHPLTHMRRCWALERGQRAIARCVGNLNVCGGGADWGGARAPALVTTARGAAAVAVARRPAAITVARRAATIAVARRAATIA
eukprot:4291747-Pleurochrysis_carterae.AAC.1